MKKLIKYLPFHFLVGLIIGIILQFNYSLWQFSFVKLLLAFIVLFTISFLLHRFVQKFLFAFSTFLLFILLGISSVYIQNPKNYKNYYGKFTNKTSNVIVTIDKVLKSGNYNHKYEAKVSQINNQKTIGRVLLNIKKDSISQKLTINDRLFLKTGFSELPPPMNPYQFDYRNYLAKRQIYQQIFTHRNQLILLKKHSFSLAGLSSSIRDYIQRKLKKHNFSTDEFAIINALILGQRKEISKELIEDYTDAGVIHILAISGLHIGILLWILSWIFQPLDRLKNGKIIKTTTIVYLLWLFAFITGLSASVVRAVTMFTFIVIGLSIGKKQFVEHSLVTSMFVLLLIKPMFLFDVGFQLSYLAVFGIVWLQPLLYRIWQPKLKPINFLWKLITVSISAQIGVLPISLYYFHQFPSLFLLSNLIIIPVLGGILICGIFIIFLVLFNSLPSFLADLYGWIISLLNKVVNFISTQQEFVFKDISMSFSTMLSWYLVILFGYIFFTRKKAKLLILFLSSIVLLQSVYLFEKLQRKSKEEFIVFHKSRKSVIGNRLNNTIQLFSDLDSSVAIKQKSIKDYIIGENISLGVLTAIPNVFQFKNRPILVVDSLGIYDIKTTSLMVILRQSPKINLNRLITKLRPKKIIADGSNFKSYVKRWKKTCEQEKTPFYYTGKNGAYILSD